MVNSMIKPSDMDAILAALTKEQWKPIKKFLKKYNTNKSQRYNDIFKSKRLNRLYLLEDNPIKTSVIDNKTIDIAKSKTLEFNDLLNKVFKYASFVNNYSPLIVDNWFSGFILSTNSQSKMKLGKFFDKVKTVLKNELKETPSNKEIPDILNSWVNLQKDFNNRPTPKSHELIVCISRSPYDVASMSTGQRWTSCQELSEYARIIEADLEEYADAIETGTEYEYMKYDRDETDEVKQDYFNLYPEDPTIDGDFIQYFMRIHESEYEGLKIGDFGLDNYDVPNSQNYSSKDDYETALENYNQFIEEFTDIMDDIYNNAPTLEEYFDKELRARYVNDDNNEYEFDDEDEDKPMLSPYGSYHHGFNYNLYAEIRLGTMVAYLIDKKDKDLKYPFARISIKCHDNIFTEEHGDYLLIPEINIYSDMAFAKNIYKEFGKCIVAFCKDVNGESGFEESYEKDPRLYDDSKYGTIDYEKYTEIINNEDLFNIDD